MKEYLNKFPSFRVSSELNLGHLTFKRGDLSTGQSDQCFSKKSKLSAEVLVGESPKLSDFRFKVAFGLPWEWKDFIGRACKSSHPFMQSMGVPHDLKAAVNVHVTMECRAVIKIQD